MTGDFEDVPFFSCAQSLADRVLRTRSGPRRRTLLHTRSGPRRRTGFLNYSLDLRRLCGDFAATCRDLPRLAATCSDLQRLAATCGYYAEIQYAEIQYAEIQYDEIQYDEIQYDLRRLAATCSDLRQLAATCGIGILKL